MSPLIVGGRTVFGALSSHPTGITTTAGSQYYDTSDNKMKVYNGTAWEEIGGAAGFAGTNATHWWKSEGIASADSWVAARGSVDFAAGGTGALTYTTGDSDFNGNKSIASSSNQYRYLTADTNSNGSFWDSSSAFSVIVVHKKTAHIGATWGDCLFVHQWSGQPDGSWAIDIEGDHTWSGSYGETFGNYGSFSFPQKGIMCVRCGASGASSQVLWWPSGASSWTTLATGTNYPSGIGNNYDAINLFNFSGASHSGHRYEGKIAEVAYFKNLRIDDTTRDAWKDYLVNKFGL
jgi:hypothetical protein|tara:strand:- start:221 stop:1093 length:873 start_codon:yes stop_codon:yes gene_type:complete